MASISFHRRAYPDSKNAPGTLPHAQTARDPLPARGSAHLVRRAAPVALPWRRMAGLATEAQGLARNPRRPGAAIAAGHDGVRLPAHIPASRLGRLLRASRGSA